MNNNIIKVHDGSLVPVEARWKGPTLFNNRYVLNGFDKRKDINIKGCSYISRINLIFKEKIKSANLSWDVSINLDQKNQEEQFCNFILQNQKVDFYKECSSIQTTRKKLFELKVEVTVVTPCTSQLTSESFSHYMFAGVNFSLQPVKEYRHELFFQAEAINKVSATLYYYEPKLLENKINFAPSSTPKQNKETKVQKQTTKKVTEMHSIWEVLNTKREITFRHF